MYTKHGKWKQIGISNSNVYRKKGFQQLGRAVDPPKM